MPRAICWPSERVLEMPCDAERLLATISPAAAPLSNRSSRHDRSEMGVSRTNPAKTHSPSAAKKYFQIILRIQARFWVPFSIK